MGQITARAAVSYLIADVLEFFNLKEIMSDWQVAMTVDFIIEEYPYLQTDDLVLCFRNAMKGRYGKLYNRIDGQIIMDWLRQYNCERIQAADQQSYNEHRAHLADTARPTEGLFYADYRAELERKAKEGDPQAAERLALSDTLLEELAARRREKSDNDNGKVRHYRNAEIFTPRQCENNKKTGVYQVG